MIIEFLKIINGVVLFCIGLTVTVWLVTKFTDFLAKTIKIKDKQ